MNRPKIVLFSGDLPSESPGQFTNYSDFNNKRKQPKRTDAIEEGNPLSVSAQKARLGNASKAQKMNAMSRPWILHGVRNSKTMAIGAVLGVIVGAILVNFGNLKEGGHISANATTWIALIGRLYLRATFCVLIPWVLSSMAMSIAEILRIGKGSRIALRVLGYFFITKVFAVCTAFAVAMAFQSQFQGTTWVKDVVEPKMVMRCGTSDTAGYMTVTADGSVVCTPLGPNMTSIPNSEFTMKDTNNVFLKYTDDSAIPETTFAQAIIQLTNDFVPDNMIRAMVSTNILSVAMFAMLFGAAVRKNYRQNSTGTHYVMDVLRQFTFVCELLVEWLLYLSPIGVFSLLAGAGASGEDLAAKVFSPQTAYFLLAFGIAIVLYSGIILPAFLYATTKINPYKYLSFIVPAQVFAFSCSSSAACIPLTMRCVESTREVSTTLARYVVTLGAPLNKDGASIYFIISTIFLVNTSQQQISSGNCVLLMLLSLISSVVTLPIPNSAPVTLFGIWATLQSGSFPVQIGYLVGINWLVDRISTVVNITGDTVVARIIADQVEKTCIREDEQTTYESAY